MSYGLPPSVYSKLRRETRKDFIEGARDGDAWLLERNYRAGGHIIDVVKAMMIAKTSDIKMTFHEASSCDLVGHNPLEEIELMKNAVLANTFQDNEFSNWMENILNIRIKRF